MWEPGFPGDSEVKNLPANTGALGDTGLIPGWGRSPGGGNSNPFQYSCWEILWTEEPGGLRSMGPQESDKTSQLNCHHHMLNAHTAVP